jgi:Rho GDP-dissociation inhibitor
MSTPPPKPPKPQSPKPPTAEGDAAVEAENTSEQADIVLKGTKNVSELMSMDTEDESLRKYKESLLGSAARGDLGDTSDPRKLIVEEFRVVFAPEENQPDIVHSLGTPEGLAKLASEGMTMKEGSKFKFRISFRVQHEIIAGIKFVNKVKAMLASETEELVIGSYPPSSEPHKFEFPKWEYSEAPKGMMLRGKYKVSNQFIDSDKVKHLEFDYELNIVK